MSTRTITVYGKTNLGTELTVNIDGEVVHKIIDESCISAFDPNLVALYAMTTDTQFHGYKKIQLVSSHSIELQRSLACYQAVWIDSTGTPHWGNYYQHQSMDDPKYLVSFDQVVFQRNHLDVESSGEFHHTLHPGIKMQYYHLIRGSFDAWYLHLEEHPDLQEQWITQQRLYGPAKKPFCQGILKRLYGLKRFTLEELEPIKNLAKLDFDKSSKMILEGGQDGNAADC